MSEPATTPLSVHETGQAEAIVARAVEYGRSKPYSQRKLGRPVSPVRGVKIVWEDNGSQGVNLYVSGPTSLIYRLQSSYRKAGDGVVRRSPQSLLILVPSPSS